MKYSDINTLSTEERQEKLTAAIEHLRQLRFAHAITPIENPMRIRQGRKHIAQLKTAQNAPTSQN